MARPRISARRDLRPARPPRVAGVRQRTSPVGDVRQGPERTEDAEAATPRAGAAAGADAAGDVTGSAARRRPRPYPGSRGSDDGGRTAEAAVAEPTADTAQGAGVPDTEGSDTERPDTDAPDTPAAVVDGAARPRRAAPPRVWWAVTALAVLVVAAGVLTTLAVLRWQRADARSTARAEVPSLAKTYAATILSYDYHHVRQDADAAARVTTGEYGRQYRQTMDQLIIPQAQQVHAVVRAEVLNAGVSSVSDDGRQATVLVFVNQTVTNDNIKGARVDQVRVRLTMVRRGDAWRVSKVDPL